MHIGWPQGIFLGFGALGLLTAALLDGQPIKSNYNLSIKMLDALITFGLLYWGGFFG